MTLPGLYWLPAAAMAVLIFWLSHQPELPEPPGNVPDWMAHAAEYGLFTLTLIFAVTRGFEHTLRSRARVAVAVGIAALYGISDEYHQSFVGRDATARDWFADVIGALIVAALVLLAWRRMAAPEDRL